MNKAITDFTGYAGTALIPVANTIHDALVANAATFPNPPTTMAALATLNGECGDALTAKSSKATADVLAFNVLRHEVEGVLGGLGDYVNAVAKGDPSIVILSGIPSYETTGHGPDTSAPPAPTGVVLRQGDLSGSLVARYRPARDRSINEVQTCLADPNVETNWHQAGMFSGGKATVSGLTPGAQVWLRVRSVGLKGVMGAWSDPAKIMVV